MNDKTTTETPTEAKSPEFHPAPGFILGKPLTREEVSNTKTTLKLTDAAGKEKDSVGIARVIELGWPRTGYYKGSQYQGPDWLGEKLEVGDLVAYMPYTDVIILDGYEKRNIIPYEKIVATAKAVK